MGYRKSVLVGDFNYAVEKEFERVERSLNEPLDVLYLRELYAEPTPLKNGLVAYADGTTWNPGSGRGVYIYKGSTWTLLG